MNFLKVGFKNKREELLCSFPFSSFIDFLNKKLYLERDNITMDMSMGDQYLI